jgi:hypothetical protein
MERWVNRKGRKERKGKTKKGRAKKEGKGKEENKNGFFLSFLIFFLFSASSAVQHFF